MVPTLHLPRMQFNLCLGMLIWIGQNLAFSQQPFYLRLIGENEQVVGKVAETAMVRSKLSCSARYNSCFFLCTAKTALGCLIAVTARFIKMSVLSVMLHVGLQLNLSPHNFDFDFFINLSQGPTASESHYSRT